MHRRGPLCLYDRLDNYIFTKEISFNLKQENLSDEDTRCSLSSYIVNFTPPTSVFVMHLELQYVLENMTSTFSWDQGNNGTASLPMMNSTAWPLGK